MTTGQAPIRIKEQGSLDLSGVGSNIGTNRNLAAASNVNGQDIYPLSVTTDHLYAQGATIYGALKSGTIFVGSGGVIVSSDADGATPTTGIIISSSQIILKNSGVDVVTLDGSDGSFSLQSGSGDYVELSSTNGLILVEDVSGTPTTRVKIDTTDGITIISNAESGGDPTQLERLTFTNSNDSDAEVWIAQGMYDGADAQWNLRYTTTFGGETLNAGIRIYPYILGGQQAAASVTIFNENVDQSHETRILLHDEYVTVTGSLTADNFDSITHDWSPSWSCSGSMTISSVSVTNAYYSKDGPWVEYYINVSFTLGGTASTQVKFTLPINAYSSSEAYAGRDAGAYVDSASGICLGWNDSATTMNVRKADNSTWALGASRQILLRGRYRWT